MLHVFDEAQQNFLHQDNADLFLKVTLTIQIEIKRYHQIALGVDGRAPLSLKPGRLASLWSILTDDKFSVCVLGFIVLFGLQHYLGVSRGIFCCPILVIRDVLLAEWLRIIYTSW